MIYLKAFGIQHGREPLSVWGAAVRYLEIAEDSYATRHIDVFENGYAIFYDRINWLDELDSLAAAQYDPVRWLKAWGPSEPSCEDEFNAVWLAAKHAPNQPQAYLDFGPWPILKRIG